MKVDLHVHAQERSGCARSGEVEVVEAAVDFGLDGLVFTDHNRFVSEDRLEELNAAYAPFRVFGGVELTVEGEDLLVLGIREHCLVEEEWSYYRLYEFVKSRGGLLILAHPFRYHERLQIDVHTCPPDAVETHSTNISVENQERIRGFLDNGAHCLKTVTNSDGHRARHVGIYYNRLKREVATLAGLVEVLKAGDYTPGGMKERIRSSNRREGRRIAAVEL